MTVHDFDAAWAEATPAPPKRIKAFGVEAVLPPRMPASAVLLDTRMRREPGRNRVEVLVAVLAEIIGAELVDQMVANGADDERLVDLLEGIGKIYYPAPTVVDDEDAEGEPTTPAPAGEASPT